MSPLWLIVAPGAPGLSDRTVVFAWQPADYDEIVAAIKEAAADDNNSIIDRTAEEVVKHRFREP